MPKTDELAKICLNLFLALFLTIPVYAAASANELSEYLETYREGANAGNPRDEYNLGASYRWGVEAPRDLALAVKWIRKAAEQKYSLAERALGEMYAKGEGVAQSNTEALVWFKRAAQHGDPSAAEAAAALDGKLRPVKK